MRIFVKYLKRILLIIFTLIVIYFFAAVIFSFLSTDPVVFNCNKKQEIFISSNGIHLDIIFPVEIISDKLKRELNIKEGAKYVSFGWGDKGFYLNTPTWNEMKLSTAVNALFLKSETALHLTNYFQKYSNWKKLEICEAQTELLLQYIEDTFYLNASGGKMEIVNSGYSPNDTFYKSKGSYSCIYTCNVWVNQALKWSGIKTSIWSPFDFGILYYVQHQ